MKQEIIETYSKNFIGVQDIYKKLNKKYRLQQIKHKPNNRQEAREKTPMSQTRIKKEVLTCNINLLFHDSKTPTTHSCYSSMIRVLKQIREEIFRKEQNQVHFLQQINPSKCNNLDRKIQQNDQRKYIKIPKLQQAKKNYIDNLQNLVNQYNSAVHSEIKMTPQKVKEIHSSKNQARQKKLEINQQIEGNLQIEDFVRILRDKKVFEKDKKNYNKNINKIIKKQNNRWQSTTLDSLIKMQLNKVQFLNKVLIFEKKIF